MEVEVDLLFQGSEVVVQGQKEASGGKDCGGAEGAAVQAGQQAGLPVAAEGIEMVGHHPLWAALVWPSQP